MLIMFSTSLAFLLEF